MTLIELRSVSKIYNGSKIVRDVSLAVEAAERLVVLGPSGCGKTTILRLLAGFIAPDSGQIRIGGEVVAADGRILREPEERNLGMVFQDLALWPHLSVRGNIELGLRARGVAGRAREARIFEMLGMVEMQDYAEARPAELSGGQQQRVALARALALRPRALLMDEPLSNLDQQLNIRMRHEILRLHALIGFTLIYVTHDREEAFGIGSRVVLMRQGGIHYEGTVEELREHLDSPT
ncbi:MAG: ABC transporter ATP-binding protein [Acidobacteria bacterium]|nr:ABC transporter ATP-binding protein [Acidobacteriota bacterium]